MKDNMDLKVLGILILVYLSLYGVFDITMALFGFFVRHFM